MKGIKQINTAQARARFLGWGTAVVVGLYGMSAVTGAHAQATTGSIFGQAPAGATVTVHSSTGLTRHVTVDAKGRYRIAVPVSVYTVMLEKDGKTTDTRTNIPLTVGRGMEVDFACPNDQCAAVEGS